MAAALVLPNAGPMSGTWNAAVIGVLNDDGYEISATIAGQEVNETDAYGLTLVEAIIRGSNWRCRLRGLEWKTGILGALLATGNQGPQPAGTGFGTLNPAIANIGDRWSKFNQVLVLTAILGNPPTSPQSLTASSAGIAPNSQSAFNATSKVKELPVELALFPYAFTSGSATFNVPFIVT